LALQKSPRIFAGMLRAACLLCPFWPEQELLPCLKTANSQDKTRTKLETNQIEKSSNNSITTTSYLQKPRVISQSLYLPNLLIFVHHF